MPEPQPFDKEAAEERKMGFIREIQRVRDGLEDDCINYHYETVVGSPQKERIVREDLKKHLRLAANRIDDIIRKL